MMKRLNVVFLMLLIFTSASARAENFTVKGQMASTIRYELNHQITTGDGMKKLMLSFVVPESFDSPTYNQQITNIKVRFSPDAEEQKTTVDARGNKILEASWNTVPRVIDATISFDAQTNTGLKPISSTAPFPLVSVPKPLKVYLESSEQVQTSDPAIRELALKLTKGSTTQFDAVQKVVSWVVDHVRYVNPPAQYDALYSLQTGKGNCQNYSHLAAALLRSVGIPVRIVNGVTMNQPMDISWEKGTLTFKMGQGRHSWVEIWFADLGWVPYDPQNMQFFISNRFVRIEVGVDNNETKNDGLVRWAQSPQARTRPTLQETIGADFLSDAIRVSAERQNYGPKNILLGPNVLARVKETAVEPVKPEPPKPLPPKPEPVKPEPVKPEPPKPEPVKPEPPKPLPPKPEPVKPEPVKPEPPKPEPVKPEPPKPLPPKPEPVKPEPVKPEPVKPEPPKPEPVKPEPPKPLPPKPEPVKPEPPKPLPPRELVYNVPFVYGNLVFPENIDFAFPRVARAKGKNSYEMSRNFLVETAEFVTHSVTQYAQVVELSRPVNVHKIALALHNFGGEGHLWVDIFQDQDGQPGELIHTTQMVALEEISMKPGYRWVNFAFKEKERPVLKPGAYWIALGFSGKPVVNWFYTYGKPVGPVYGTRYKSIFAREWSGALNYEFNYKVVGMTVK